MLDIKNVSLFAFSRALRYARMYDFPHDIADWTKEYSDRLQVVAEEFDRRDEKRYEKENKTA